LNFPFGGLPGVLYGVEGRDAEDGPSGVKEVERDSRVVGSGEGKYIERRRKRRKTERWGGGNEEKQPGRGSQSVRSRYVFCRWIGMTRVEERRG